MTITLTGPNDFMIKQTLDVLRNGFIQKYGQEGIETYSGEELEASQLPSILQGGSLFSSHRLVVLRDVAKQKNIWDALDDLLPAVPEEVILVIAESQLDKRTKTYKTLKKLSDFKEFALLDERQLGQWVIEQAKRAGKAIDRSIAAYVVSRVGPDQWQLSQEISKLLLQTTITKEIIDEIIVPNPQASAFDLLDAALSHDSNKVSSIVRTLQITEDPYRLFGLLVSQVHTLAIVANAGAKSADSIAKEAGLHPFAVKKMQAQLRTVSPRRLQMIIQEVAQLDDRLKSTGEDPWLLLRQCIMSIAGQK